MPWQITFLAVLFVLNGLATIAQVDKPREPITPGMAVFIVLCQIGLLALLASMPTQ